MFKKIVGLVVAFMMAFSIAGAASAYAKPLSQLKQDLQTTKSQKTQAQTKYDNAKAKESSLNAKISTLKAKIAKTESEIAKLAAEVKKYQDQVTKISNRISKLEFDLKDQNSDLNSRLRVMYMTGDQNILEVLLGSKSIIDFMSNIDMVKEIHSQDVKILNELQGKLNEVQVQKAQLVKVKQMLESSKQQQEAKNASLASDKRQLDAEMQQAQKQAMDAWDEVMSYESEQSTIMADIQNYYAEQAAQEAARKAAQNGGGSGGSGGGGGGGSTPSVGGGGGNFSGGNGSLGWPVHGPITSPFGWRIHPIYGYRKMHTGIDIGVPQGTPVHAAADGTVITAGWGGGYGNMVIIGHAGGLSTLYGHNSRLACHAGEHVSRGEVIAYSGMTGTATGPHVHFEVRVNGVPKNPMGWL